MVTEKIPSPTDVFRQRLRTIRQRRGLNQKQLAERLSALNGPVDRAVIAKTELGTRGVSLDDAFLYAVALGIPFDWLVTPHASDDLVAVTPNTHLDANTVRQWMSGAPLPGQSDDEDVLPYAPGELLRALRLASDELQDLVWREKRRGSNG